MKGLCISLLALSVGCAWGADGAFWPADDIKVQSMCGAQIAVKDGAAVVDVRPNEPWSGVAFGLPQAIDLADYGSVLFSVSNRTDAPLTLAGEVKSPGVAGPLIRSFVELAPRATGVIRLRLAPPSLPLNVELPGMRGYEALKTEARATLRRIGSFHVFRRRGPKGASFAVTDIRACGRIARAAVSAPEGDAFFPFCDRYGQFRHAEWPGKVHSDADLAAARAREEKWLAAHAESPIRDADRFGGWAKGPQLKATGFFRTEKVNGKWWFVDPDGHLFYSQGIDGVRVSGETGITGRERFFEWLPPADDAAYADCWRRFRGGSAKGYYKTHYPYTAFSFARANQIRKYGKDWHTAVFADLAQRRLRAWGLNTIANWSSEAAMLARRTPYTDTFDSRTRRIPNVAGRTFPDPFAPEFEKNLRADAAKHAAKTGSDPWCLGWFVDNEIGWGETDSDLARAALAAPDGLPAKTEFLRRLRAQYGDGFTTNQVTETDFRKFHRAIADKYFSTVRAAIKAVAPNRLYLGCRFAWGGPEAWRAAADHCDVVSVNTYHAIPDRMPPADAADKPLLIGEFHFGALDRGMLHTGLVPTLTQRTRAEMYKTYVRAARANDRIVGAHWFIWRDQPLTGRGDGEDFQIGFLDVTDQPYMEMVEAARELAAELYPVVHTDPYDYKKTVQRRVAPVTIDERIPGRRLVDFGKEAFGFLEFLPPPGTRGPYEVRLGELLKSDGSVNMKPGATIRAARVVGTIDHDGVHRVPLVADRRNTSGGREGGAVPIPPEHGVIMPFRYAEVFSAPFPVTDETVRMVAVNYPIDMSESAFDSSDARLNTLYDFCKYSILATSFAGLYVDGDRERIPYEADAYLNQLGDYAVHSDYSLARASHEYLMRHPTWPTEWKQHSIKMAWTDWMWSGDTRSIAKFYDQLKNEKLLERFRRADGLLLTGGERKGGALTNHVGAADIVDWPLHERDGFVFKDVNSVVNAFYYRNLLEMADIARALGRTSDADGFAARAKDVKTAYNRVFFDAARRVYRDGEGTDHASQHANAAALAFGLVPPEQARAVADYCVSRGMACSVYFAQYLLEALFEAGCPDAALAFMTATGDRSWLDMLDQGATITMEAWSVRYKPNLDLNHAWGTPPINVISRYVLGVTPLEAGFAKIRIRPMVGSLARVAGTVPTAKGAVRVRVENGTLTVDTPAPARIEFAGRTLDVPAGHHAVKAEARIYPVPACEERHAAGYSVTVDGREAPVSAVRNSAMPVNIRWPGHQRELDQTEIGGLVRFAFTGSAQVVVTAPRDFAEVKIRPLSKGVKPVVSGRTVTFTLTRPGGYSVDFDGIHDNLLLLADPPADYAVDRTSRDTIYFGPGEHDAGLIELKGGQTLYIDEGAVVFGRVHAKDADHIRILGRGILDGSRVKAEILPIDPKLAEEQRRKGFAITNYRRWDEVRIEYCDDVLIDGVTIRDSPLYNIRPICCRGLTIRNVKLCGNWRYNSDGIDMHNCENVRISDCFIRTFDDSICVKGFDYRMDEKEMLHDGHLHDVFTNAVIERCTVWCDWGHSLEFGAETRARDISGIVFRDCDVIRAASSVCDIQNCDYADIHDILFEDIRIELDSPVYRACFSAKASDFNPQPLKGASPAFFGASIRVIPEYSKDGAKRGLNRDITLRNIYVTGPDVPRLCIDGFDANHRTMGVTVDGVYWNGAESTARVRAAQRIGRFATPPTYR